MNEETNERPTRRNRRFGALSPQEAGRKSAQARARKAREREAAREALDSGEQTFRDRLALSLSRLDQSTLDSVVSTFARQAAQGNEKSAHVLARLADQAFGRTPQAVEEQGDDDGVIDRLTREQRSAIQARLIREIEELEEAARMGAVGSSSRAP